MSPRSGPSPSLNNNDLDGEFGVLPWVSGNLYTDMKGYVQLGWAGAGWGVGRTVKISHILSVSWTPSLGASRQDWKTPFHGSQVTLRCFSRARLGTLQFVPHSIRRARTDEEGGKASRTQALLGISPLRHAVVPRECPEPEQHQLECQSRTN